MSFLTFTTSESVSGMKCGSPGNFPVDVVSKSFLKNWLLCKGLLPSFIILGNRFLFVLPGSSSRIV